MFICSSVYEQRKKFLYISVQLFLAVSIQSSGGSFRKTRQTTDIRITFMPMKYFQRGFQNKYTLT